MCIRDSITPSRSANSRTMTDTWSAFANRAASRAWVLESSGAPPAAASAATRVTSRSHLSAIVPILTWNTTRSSSPAMCSNPEARSLSNENSASSILPSSTRSLPAVQITAGNERVLEGRIEDAEFSFDKDLASGLEHMVGELDRVVFHVKIGTMADKSERLVGLTGALAEATGVQEDSKIHALEAARLAKADQVSVMVREFADLEGVMGETYARIEGFPSEVAQAIREQYLPDAAGGAPPRTLAGALLATAEKVDNIVGAFACGEPPSGSKDPYGLRRAAMGMVTIAFMHGLEYDVRALVGAAYAGLDRFPNLVGRDPVSYT